MVQEYVAGFLFRQGWQDVALIEKQHPAWQKGKLNAIGGKVEAGEAAADAMVREFAEETGQRVEDWRRFCTLHHYSRDGVVHFFVAYVADARLYQKTDEVVDWWPVARILAPGEFRAMKNLRWLIPMAMDLDLIEVEAHDRSPT